MELKRYQRRIVEEVERYLAEVAKEREDGNKRFAAQGAWQNLRLGKYEPRRNGIGEDMPTFCIKVPTGGGKTLLATQALGSIYRTILKDRNGAGLVLWVVPSSEIYRQTLKRLSNRRDLYRIMLEHAVSRRIEVWEKQDIARLSPVRLRDCLNILVVQLASTNRETKEQLKFFKDSGGNIVGHFPPERNYDAHRKLKEQVPNLEMLSEDAKTGQFLCKTSIGNLVRLCKPAVILDEGHKATSELARKTIEGFNASVVVELSATPRDGANIVSRVSGDELLQEEMIKLPLNVATSAQKNWQDVLTQARDKRVALAHKAAEYVTEHSGPAIRPIVLVQVERTGKDQRGPDYIHALDVRDYLMQRLGIPDKAIAIKSAEDDGLAEVDDLMEPGCPIEWIITKSALQEGWDCPFAYILVSLNNTKSGLSMTQLVGRVLRQPYQRQTPYPELNESYIYCLKMASWETVRQVKAALEKEGYEGDIRSVVDITDGMSAQKRTMARIRPEFLGLYKPFDGKIYLPRFCVKEGKEYQSLDYFIHLISQVEVAAFEYKKVDWRLDKEIKAARDNFYRITLGQEPVKTYDRETDLYEADDRVISWMVAALNQTFRYLSWRQIRHVVETIYAKLCIEEALLKNRLALVKFVVRDHTERFIRQQVDVQTKLAFERLFKSGKLVFYLECKECRFNIPQSVEVRATRMFMGEDGRPPKRSLFDYVDEAGFNEYEKAVALYLDQHDEVLYWYRNLVGPGLFDVQGYRKNRIRPDFVVQHAKDAKPAAKVLVLESKGKHLKGNEDTEYKRDVASYFEQTGKRVPWQKLAKDFKDNVFRFQVLDEDQQYGRGWRDELRKVLEAE